MAFSGPDAQLLAHRRCLAWGACLGMGDVVCTVVLAVVLSQVAESCPVWPLIPIMVNRVLELLGCFYGHLTALHALLQIPLSLLTAVMYGVRYESCSNSNAGGCVPVAAAPVLVFVEVLNAIVLVHLLRWYTEELLHSNTLCSPTAQSPVEQQPDRGTAIIRPAPRRGLPGSVLERAERGENFPLHETKAAALCFVKVIQPDGDPACVLAIRVDFPSSSKLTGGQQEGQQARQLPSQPSPCALLDPSHCCNPRAATAAAEEFNMQNRLDSLESLGAVPQMQEEGNSAGNCAKLSQGVEQQEEERSCGLEEAAGTDVIGQLPGRMRMESQQAAVAGTDRAPESRT